jgi:hypothetical protein
MRPVPRSRHLVAVIIFAAAASGSGLMALYDENLSDTQIEMATGAIKRHQPELFRQDFVYGDSRLWRVHSPALYGWMDLVLVPTDYRDPTLPFRIMTGVVVMVYLCSMYPLLYRQCRSWSVSAFVSVLSTTVIFALGGSYWGVGSLGSITPRALYIAVIPLVMLAYLRYVDTPRLPLVFAFIGLMGNFHLMTAMNLTVVLLIVHLGTGRFAARRWPMTVACGLSAAVGAAPYVLYYFALRAGADQCGAAASSEVVTQALEQLALLYPAMLKDMLYWLLMVLALAIPAGAVLLRVERFRTRDLGLWAWFIVAGLVTSLVLHGLSQVVGLVRGAAPPVIDLVQASGLVMLPLYVLLAQGLTNLFRIVRAYRHVLRWACAAFMVAWMLPSNNLRVLRHWAYDAATMFMKEEDKWLRIQELHVQQRERAELAAIADWARANTATDAVFVTDRGEFRMRARRAIVGAEKDARFVYYLAPWRMAEWWQRYRRQGPVLEQGDAPNLRRLAQEVSAGPGGAARWYVILHAGRAPEAAAGLTPELSDRWGKQVKLYWIDVAPASSPTTTARSP